MPMRLPKHNLPVLAILAALCFLHTGCVTEPVSKTKHETRALVRVLRVFIDGETMELSNGVKVRCAGCRPPAKPKIGQRPSPEFIAALEIIRKLAVGGKVWVKFPSGAKLKFDPKKIYPAYVWLRQTRSGNVSEYQDVLLNAMLLRAGAGRPALEEVPDEEIRKLLQDATDEAKRKQRGVWGRKK